MFDRNVTICVAPVGDAQFKAVYDIAKAACDGCRITGRYQPGGVDAAAEQCGQRFRAATRLDHLDVLHRVHVQALECLNDEIMCVAAEATDPDFFTLEVFRPLYFRLAENAVGKKIFYTADKYEVGKPLNDGAHVPDRAGHTDFGVAVQRCRSRHWRRRDEHQTEVEIVFFEQAGFVGDPRHRLRHHLRRMETDQAIGSARGRNVGRHEAGKHQERCDTSAQNGKIRRHDMSLLAAMISGSIRLHEPGDSLGQILFRNLSQRRQRELVDRLQALGELVLGDLLLEQVASEIL